MSLRAAYSRRLRLGDRRNASGCSLWPAPDAAVAQDGEAPETWLARRERVKLTAKNGNGMGMPLAMASQLWPTATSLTPARNGNSAAGNSDGIREMERLAVPIAALWAAPAARDVNGANSLQHVLDGIAANGRGHMDQLANQAAHGFRHPCQETWTAGPLSPAAVTISRRLFRAAISGFSRAIKRRWSKAAWRRSRRLNPLFVEWLMRWPPGHALCGCSETEWTHWQRDMRSALSRLPMVSGPSIWAAPETAGLLALMGDA